MDSVIVDFYQRYGRMVNYSRAIPLSIDGLKPVERRVLLSAYDIAREKFTKCAKIDGYCLGQFHPHSTVYGTIVQMVHQGFLDGQGNFGTDIGVEDCPAAAERYTEAKLNKEMYDMAFRLIKYSPVKDGEMAGDTEPVYLPTMYPICLLGKSYSQGIGFGFKTYIPCYKKEDLHKRLLWLLGKRKTKPTIKPISNCDILSNDSGLEELLTTGKATIKVKGKYTLEPHVNKLILHSWPEGRGFESLLKKFTSELDINDIGFQDLSAQDQTRIVFEVLKQRNRDIIYKEFIKKMDIVITGAISFETITVKLNEKGTPYVTLTSIDSMLLDTYNMYKEINQIMLQSEKKNIIDLISEFQYLEKIRPELSIEIKNKITNIDDIVKRISDKTKISIDIIKNLISKYRINKLLTLDTDITSLQKEIQEYDQNLKDIDNFVLKQYGTI